MDNFGVHVNLPLGALEENEQSSGIAIACALVSLFCKIPLKSMIAMTGELSLQGYVFPVCK